MVVSPQNSTPTNSEVALKNVLIVRFQPFVIRVVLVKDVVGAVHSGSSIIPSTVIPPVRE